MVEIIDLVSDDDTPRAVRRSRPRPVKNDAELSIVEEHIHPLNAAQTQRSQPQHTIPPAPATPSDAHAGAGTRAKRKRRGGDDCAPQVVALKKGINPLQDYPHARYACTRVPFDAANDSASAFCNKCFCFVCDVLAEQCQKWADHCRAVDNDEWKRKRREVRKATRRYERGVDRLAKDARRKEKRARTEQERRLVMEALGETRNFAELMAEQINIASQMHDPASTDSSSPSPSSADTASPCQGVGAPSAPQPFNLAASALPLDGNVSVPVPPDTTPYLATTLTVPPSTAARAPLNTAGVPLTAAQVLRAAHSVNQVGTDAANITTTAHASPALMPRTSLSDTSTETENSSPPAKRKDGGGWAERETRRERLERLLKWQKTILDARALGPYPHSVHNAQSTANRNADAATEEDRSKSGDIGGTAKRGAAESGARDVRSYEVDTSTYGLVGAEETRLERGRSRKRRVGRSAERSGRSGRSADRGSRRERSSSASHFRMRKVSRLRRSSHK